MYKYIGLGALPVASKVASMKVMLTPQQHYAVKKHLTQQKRATRKKAEVAALAQLETCAVR